MYIVFGGNSDIACEISKELSNKSAVLHVTRKITINLKSIFEKHPKIDLAEMDLSKSEETLLQFSQLFEHERIDGIIFAHRYRGESDNAVDQYKVEVITPHLIIKKLSELKPKFNVSVVLFSSPAANFIVGDQDFNYHASKASIEALIKFSSLKYSNGTIRINGVSPGSFVYKNRNKKFYEANPELHDKIVEFIPIKKINNARNIARVVLFLCSDDASYINGDVINLDGGYLHQEPSFLI